MLLLIGLVPATLYAAPVPTYASIDARNDLARSCIGAGCYASGNSRLTAVDPTDPQNFDLNLDGLIPIWINGAVVYQTTTASAVLSRGNLDTQADYYRVGAVALGFDGFAGAYNNLSFGYCGVPTQTSGETRYYHADAIGSTRLLTDAAGTIVTRHDFLAFGEEPSAAAVSNVRRFAGKERDVETGFDYFGARYYASGSGRFTTVDPMVPFQASLRDPQLWNRYAYVRNNPLRYTDPDGRCIWDLCIGEIAFATGVTEAAVGAVIAATAATGFVWSKREAIARSVTELGTAAGLALRQAVDSVTLASRADPYALPDNYPRIDKTGKAHTRDQTLPDHVPESWNREMLDDAARTLRKSIRARQDEAKRLGEDPGHRNRIRDEERLLRQINTALKEYR